MAKGSAKKPSDSNAPKRPLSGYFSYINTIREEVSNKYSDLSMAQRTKKMSEMWNGLSDGEKAKFTDKAAEEKAVYDKKLATYKTTDNYKNFQKELDAWKMTQTKKPFKKDANRPKRPLSGYMIYIGEQRPALMAAGLKMTETASAAAKKWKELGEAGQKPYNDKAAKLKAEHAKTIEEYEKSDDHKNYLAEKEAYMKKQSVKRKGLSGSAGPKKKNKTSKSKSKSKSGK